MVRANVIKKDGTIVTIKCFPELKEERAFEMVLDLKKKEVLKNDSKDYMPGLMNPYAMHSSHEMFTRYEKTGVIPEKIEVAWY